MTSLAALLGVSCNAAVGGGVVALVGGAGYLAAQCYDRVRVVVRDPATGLTTCNAEVSVADAGGSERELRPCYNAALTDGRWTITARQPGYAPASTELIIPEHEGACPSYTHSIELTLRRPGERAAPPAARGAGDAAPSVTTPGIASELDSPPARVVPPPIPVAPAAPESRLAPAAAPAPATESGAP